MQRRCIGCLEREPAAGDKSGEIGQIVAVGGQSQGRRAAFGGLHLEKRLEMFRDRRLPGPSLRAGEGGGRIRRPVTWGSAHRAGPFRPVQRVPAGSTA